MCRNDCRIASRYLGRRCFILRDDRTTELQEQAPIEQNASGCDIDARVSSVDNWQSVFARRGTGKRLKTAVFAVTFLQAGHST
jgi:hypothetical protein